MSNTFKNYLKASIYLAFSILFILCLISFPKSFQDWKGYINISVFLTIIISILYEKYLWKLNPFNKTPKLYRKYYGLLEFNYNGEQGRKNIKVIIRQSLLNINVKLVTDEIISSTITSKIVKENGNFVLYYTYITNPHSKFSDKNPIQYGTCRLIIDDPKRLIGIYWTTRRTKGDIRLERTIESNEGFEKKLIHS